MFLYHPQRKHIINSLDTLLYQLHTLSFLLCPVIWPYICRLLSQYQFSRPRDADPKRSIRFWFFLIVFFNIGSLWTHLSSSYYPNRSVILDFVGIQHKPSPLHLITLDFLIIALDMLLVFIAFETSLFAAQPSDSLDPLLPPTEPIASSLLSIVPPNIAESPIPIYILDLRFPFIISRLRHSPPQPPQSSTANSLPLPNTASSWQIPNRFQMLMRARSRMMQQARVTPPPPDEGASAGSGRIPGTFDPDDDR
ncbi:hypothetical protein C8Q75DRAFT_793427 [Abortiporus biennis]|nr:hypothetical protein C8Q75DRAFT_793427 [Abortiporus biennis]